MDSTDLLKRAFLIGLGATVSTAEKLGKSVKDLADELVARGDIQATEVKKLIEELRKLAGAAAEKSTDSKKEAAKKATKKTPTKKSATKKTTAKKSTVKVTKKETDKKSAAKKPVAKKKTTVKK